MIDVDTEKKDAIKSKMSSPPHLWYSSMTNDPTVVSNCTWV